MSTAHINDMAESDIPLSGFLMKKRRGTNRIQKTADEIIHELVSEIPTTHRRENDDMANLANEAKSGKAFETIRQRRSRNIARVQLIHECGEENVSPRNLDTHETHEAKTMPPAPSFRRARSRVTGEDQFLEDMAPDAAAAQRSSARRLLLRQCSILIGKK